jgi:hypothetical protein
MNLIKSKSISNQLVFLLLILLIPLIGAMILALLIGAISAIGIGMAFTLIAAVGWYIDFRKQHSLLRFALLVIIAILFGYALQLFSLQWFGTPSWLIAILSLLVISMVGMLEISIFCTQILQPRLSKPQHDIATNPVTGNH